MLNSKYFENISIVKHPEIINAANIFLDLAYNEILIYFTFMSIHSVLDVITFGLFSQGDNTLSKFVFFLFSNKNNFDFI